MLKDTISKNGILKQCGEKKTVIINFNQKEVLTKEKEGWKDKCRKKALKIKKINRCLWFALIMLK